MGWAIFAISAAAAILITVSFMVLCREYLKGYEDGFTRGYDSAYDEARPWLPWNAPSKVLREWADIRGVEEMLSSETEEFLKALE